MGWDVPKTLGGADCTQLRHDRNSTAQSTLLHPIDTWCQRARDCRASSGAEARSPSHWRCGRAEGDGKRGLGEDLDLRSSFLALGADGGHSLLLRRGMDRDLPEFRERNGLGDSEERQESESCTKNAHFRQGLVDFGFKFVWVWRSPRLITLRKKRPPRAPDNMARTPLTPLV